MWDAYKAATPKVRSLLDLAYQGAGIYNPNLKSQHAPPADPARLHNSLTKVLDMASGDDRAEIQKVIDRLGYKAPPKAPIPLPKGVLPPTQSRDIRNIRRRGFSSDTIGFSDEFEADEDE